MTAFKYKLPVPSREAFDSANWTNWGVAHCVTKVQTRAGDQRLTAVEVEVESDTVTAGTVQEVLANIPNCVWVQAEEGSLRNNGFEVVFRGPQPYDQALIALSQVYPLFNGVRSTFRAAVHVHFNVQDLSRAQYIRILIAYALMEQHVYTTVGNGRDESVFCVPWWKAHAAVRALFRAYNRRDGDGWAGAIISAPKYSGLNLKATSKYGSLEFRHLQTPAGGPMAAVTAIAEYIDMCHSIIQLALGYGCDTDLFKYTDDIIEHIETTQGRVIPPSHVAYVYTLLVGDLPVDVVSDGLSVAAAHSASKAVLPATGARLRLRRRSSRDQDRVPRQAPLAGRSPLLNSTPDDIGALAGLASESIYTASNLESLFEGGTE